MGGFGGGGGGRGGATPVKNCIKERGCFCFFPILPIPLKVRKKCDFFLTYGTCEMARKCVHWARFAKVNGIPIRKRGFQVDADLVCGKKRNYIYLGKKGNTGRYGAKYGKGGCKFGWRYEYKNKDDKMQTACKRTKNLKIRVSAVKGMGATIPEYKVKRRASSILGSL